LRFQKKIFTLFVIASQFLTSMPTAVLANEIKTKTDSLMTANTDEVTSTTTTETESSTTNSTETNESTTSSSESQPVKPEKPATNRPVQNPANPPRRTKAKKSPKRNTFQSVQSADSEDSSLSEVSNSEKSLLFIPARNTWEFIDLIGEEARKVGQENDLYASVLIAQAILESGSGKSNLSQAPYYNLFGIKGSYKGRSVVLPTQEDTGNGSHYSTQAVFRQYNNYKESLADYARLLLNGLPQNKNYYQGVWKKYAKNYQQATLFLTGRYATDTQYNQKLNALIQTYQLTDYDQPQDKKKKDSDYLQPVANSVISSNFGSRAGEFHRGIDFAAANETPIHAAKEGLVIRSEWHPSWGNYVVILHPDGLTTLYAHASRNVVKVNQKVKQKQVISYVGSTGNSTGPHLHFEVNRSTSLTQSSLLDPLTVLK